jgi:hypothetical protein
MLVLVGTALVAATLFTGLVSLRPYHPTAVAALQEFPGYLAGLERGAYQVLRTEHVTGGQVLLYRWRAADDASGDTWHLARTYVTPVQHGLRRGWRAQASGATTFHAADTFVAAYAVGGNVRPLSSAFGLAQEGRHVRVQWADGRTDDLAIEDGNFLLSRPETVQVTRIELLDAEQDVLRAKDLFEAE